VVIVFYRENVKYLPTLLEELRKSSKEWIAVDTETTGLHLKADKPFLITLTFDDKSRAIDLDEKNHIPTAISFKVVLQEIFNEIKKFKYVVGHNI